jgi:predicted phosphodiesterase
VRVAALFDIHGNLPALEAVLGEVEAASVDLLVCGGDAVPGPFPHEILSILRGFGDRLRYVHGNGERNLLRIEEATASDDPLAAQARWCAERLSPEELEYLAGLPAAVTIAVDGLGDVLFCHGTPRSDEEIVTLVTPDERLREILANVHEPVVVAGHTHSQLDRTVGSTRFVNGGSIGMPYEREQGAYWTLLGPEIELRRTTYDAEDAADRIRATGFPDATLFAQEYVLSRHSPDETAPFFEGMVAERTRAAQSANSEK